MDSSRTTLITGALFALNMLVNTAAGDTYTFAEVSEILQKAGFINEELLRDGDQKDDLVQAQKP
jgi:hypothetical protein